jgi:uncharacterized protein
MKVLRPLLIAGLMLAYQSAHATSFDCHKGHSLTEKMICNDPALSKLDDTLGQLYWKARRRVVKRREFLDDSDSKWAWREANCRDAACLSTWYETRIGELRELIDSMQARTTPMRPVAPLVPERPEGETAPTLTPAPVTTDTPTALALQECTSAHPGIVVNEQCSTVLGQRSRPWKVKQHDNEWFCGVAMLPPSEMAANAGH